MSTDVLDKLDNDIDSDLEPGKHTHIVKSNAKGKSAQVVVLEARIFGLTVEALCGFQFIPQRDPKSLPVCKKCEEIAGMYQSFGFSEPTE